MADLEEPFELCKVLQNGSLLGISRHAEEDHVLLTFRDRGVLVYNLQHQKLIGIWSVEQRDEVTCAAVHNHVDRNFVMAVNKSEIFVWKETDCNLKQCQRMQTKKDIFSLLVWNNLQTDPVVVFEDGSSMSLTGIVAASETKRVKRQKTTKLSKNLLWSFAIHYKSKPYSASIMALGKNKYIVKVTNHGSSDCVDREKTAMDFKLTPPSEDALLLSCCAYEEGHCITSYWSDGSLCITELEAILQSALSDSTRSRSPLTCRRIQRLHPAAGTSKDRGSVALAAIDHDHVFLCGSIAVKGILKDAVTVWNTKYGTLQSWQTLDKLTALQSSLQRSVQPSGVCCACCIPGFICVGFCHSVAVCQFSVDPCSLASALGQLDSTANFLKGERLKPELLVTPKLAEPGDALKNWQKTLEMDDCVENEVLQKLIDPSKTPTEEEFCSNLKTYMTVKQGKQGDKAQASKAKKRQKCKKRMLSQHFISEVLSRCVNEKTFWARDSVSELLMTKRVPCSSSKELLNCIVEKNDLELLKECFQYIKGIPEDTVVLCLRHVLRQEDAALEDQATEMPLDKDRANYLCAILCYPVNDVFLLPCLKKLSFEDVILLLKFFTYLMDRGLSGFQDSVDCKSLTYPQVLDWTGLVLNAHFSQLVISPEAHELLVRCHKTVTQQVRTYGKLRALEGFLGHFKKRKSLPKVEEVGLYTIEELEL